MKKSNHKGFKIDSQFVLLILMGIGFVFTMIYIFYTSTALLHSDSVITAVIAHLQKVDHEFILSHWYYGNEFWLFSLSIPTLILSFFMNNNLLIRQLGILFISILFFVLLYYYGKKFLSKKETLFLIAIFLSGISYSVLDYFYAYNAYLTVVINSMLLLFLYYNCFIEKKNKCYIILTLVITFLLNMGSLRYFPSVVIPFIITQIIFLLIENKKINFSKFIHCRRVLTSSIVLIISFLALGMYAILVHTYHFENRASTGETIELTTSTFIQNVGAVVECVNNFFGYDNRDHSYTFMTGKLHFLPQNKDYSVYSLLGISNFIKLAFCLLFMVFVPIILFKRYKENDEKINFLLIFNTCSWLVMIYIFIFSSSFFHHYSELKYFLFNMVISLILGLYCVYKYLAIHHNMKFLINTFLICYIISNLYTTAIVIDEHDQDEMDRRYEVVKVLKENDLTFGYGDFWSGLFVNFFSDYQIEVASVEFDSEIEMYRWYSDERLYSKKYHTGKTFILIDNSKYINRKDIYEEEYGIADDIVECSNYSIMIYNHNPLLNILD